MLISTTRVLTVTVIGALLIAGCVEPLTEEEYVEQAAVTVEELYYQFDRGETAASGWAMGLISHDKAEETLRDVRGKVDSIISEWESVVPPEAIETEHDRAVKAFRTIADGLSDMIKCMDTFDMRYCERGNDNFDSALPVFFNWVEKVAEMATDDGKMKAVLIPDARQSDESDGMGRWDMPETGVSTGDSEENEPAPQKLEAYFTWSPEHPRAGDPVEFAENSVAPEDQTITSWSWDFGDESISNTRNPSHTYTQEGDYVVMLEVETDNDSASFERRVSVSGNPPNVWFSWSPEEPDTGDEIQFTDESTQSDGSIVSWQWDFGDGSSSEEQNPTQVYSQEGEYAVKLTVTNSNGESASLQNYVMVSGNPPNVWFSWSPEQPETGQEVTFTDESTQSGGYSIVSWHWDFGDGSTSAEQNPPHTFWEAGEHTAKLTVTNDNDESSSLQNYVTVNENPPDVWFSWSPENPDAGEQVQFTDESTQSGAHEAESWSWEFGDGATSEDRNPTHAYDDGGEYLVELTVTNSNNESSYRAMHINITDP